MFEAIGVGVVGGLIGAIIAQPFIEPTIGFMNWLNRPKYQKFDAPKIVPKINSQRIGYMRARGWVEPLTLEQEQKLTQL